MNRISKVLLGVLVLSAACIGQAVQPRIAKAEYCAVQNMITATNTRTGEVVDLGGFGYGYSSASGSMTAINGDVIQFSGETSTTGGNIDPAVYVYGNGVSGQPWTIYPDYSYYDGQTAHFDFTATVYNANSGSLEIQTPCASYSSYYSTSFSSILSIIPGSLPPTFSLSCGAGTTTITAGQTASFSLSTTAANGFNSAVNFSSSINPNPSYAPSVSFSNNGAVPDATTVATVSTVGATPGNTYTITFTGTGGGVTQTCSRQLVVNAVPAGFSLSVTPSSSSVMKGNNATYTVTATCSGPFTGPVTNLTASSFYSNATYSFSSTSVGCGQSVTLTVGNTGSVPSNQLSTPQSQTAQTITVTGQGN